MTNPVMILTDSSVYLPADLVVRYPIRVIPFTLTWNGMTYRDGVDIQAKEFYERLSTSNSIPTTSQVSAGELHQHIQPLLDAGYDVLLLLISSGLSSTHQTAVSEVQKFPKDRVAVLDTKLVSMPLGFQVITAARAALAGANLAECQQVAHQVYENIGAYFTVDTLKYLAAGGRINSAKRILGSALNIKPILEIRGGKIELVCSVISQKKAVDRMLDLAEEAIGGRTPVYLSICHTLVEERARELLEIARARFSPVEIFLSEVSPVIGVHIGPGVLAIVYQSGVEETIAPNLMKMRQKR